MTINPEFLRNLWLEFSLTRLIATPVVLGLVFILMHNTEGPAGVVTTAAFLFFGATAAWGAGLASSALLREIQVGTWPLQRLTAIHPWPMTWGKLFGATAYAWYIGFWCLVAIAFAAGSLTEKNWALINDSLLLTIVTYIGLTIFFHAVALLSALLQVSHRRAAARRRSLLVVLGLIILGITLINAVSRLEVGTTSIWWDTEWPADFFWLISLYLFVGWAMLGATMLMRRELQVPNQPWVWLAFLVFINLYVAGFVHSTNWTIRLGLSTAEVRLSLATLVTVGLCYVLVFSEGTTVVDLSRLLQRLRHPLRTGAFREFPRWALTAIAAWLLGLVLLAVHAANSPETTEFVSARTPVDFDFPSFVLAGLLFQLRDLAIVLFARFGDKKDRAMLAAVAYLAILYFLIPWLLQVVTLDQSLFLFLPTGYSPWTIGILPPLLQAGIAWALAIRRWRRAAASLPVM